MSSHKALRIELLGGLSASWGGAPITHFETRKAATLLAYLALFNQRPHPREVLSELLWPEEDPDATRERLRQGLSSIRRVLEPSGDNDRPLLVASRTDVYLDREMFSTDVVDFESATKVGRINSEAE